MARQFSIHLDFEEVYSSLKRNEWIRSKVATELDVSTTTINNYVRRMRAVGYEIENVMVGTRGGRKAEDYGVRGMATNEERLRYLDNPTTRG